MMFRLFGKEVGDVLFDMSDGHPRIDNGDTYISEGVQVQRPAVSCSD
jgi:hypothetical protein